MFPDQSHNLLHAVVGSQDERYTHDLVPAPELADEFPPGGILEHRGGGLEVLGDVLQRELGMVRTGAEQTLGAGHLFVIVLREGYPINVTNVIQMAPEVCTIFCATANAVEVIVAETGQGRGVLGVVDGSSPKGVETEQDAQHRRDFLRKIGYKR